MVLPDIIGKQDVRIVDQLPSACGPLRRTCLVNPMRALLGIKGRHHSLLCHQSLYCPLH